MFSKKLRGIFGRFVLMSIGTVGVYSILDWFLVFKTGSIGIDEDIVKFWLPFVVPWLPVLLWLRPRIGTLKLTGANGNLPFLYMFVAAAVIAAPTIVAQEYVSRTTGILGHFADVTTIDNLDGIKFVELDKIQVDKTLAGLEKTATVSGKHNEDLNFGMFFVCPIYDPQLYPKFTTNVWLGSKYSRRTNQARIGFDREQEWRSFFDDSVAKYNTRDLTRFTFLEQLGNNRDRHSFESAVANSKISKPAGPAVILIPHNEKFEDRAGHTFQWIFGSFAIGVCIWFIMLVVAKVDTEKMDRLLKGRLSNDKAWKELRLLLPRPGNLIAPIIVALNLIVFLAMVFSGLGVETFRTVDLIAWGANYGPYVHGEGVVRLLTSTFVHGGLMHLALNVYGLIFAGMYLEPLIGPGLLAVVYGLTGIAASTTSVLIHPATVSVGASGAIFGLFGALIALLMAKRGGNSGWTGATFGQCSRFRRYQPSLRRHAVRCRQRCPHRRLHQWDYPWDHCCRVSQRSGR